MFYIRFELFLRAEQGIAQIQTNKSNTVQRDYAKAFMSTIRNSINLNAETVVFREAFSAFVNRRSTANTIALYRKAILFIQTTSLRPSFAKQFPLLLELLL